MRQSSVAVVNERKVYIEAGLRSQRKIRVDIFRRFEVGAPLLSLF